ncbi:NAD(P)-dependent dehydrogenase (short-subunit alcohol dehydrogenase family) [Mycolicibacterium sp. BK556]|uniref:SDR family oxidoreductase n=1 Tax=Mycobacteriaceae TaxID=1762 RepID=UPI00105F5335|nr:MULTISPECIES: SDR family oxidoreductase [Mycobacteriaceae]MBB3604994.1 NAD(P)-dependent dehydrogenase (short-subunit alcohol dehydrogenase family) [Mycolicibacterium sp. BK556]MBB3635190.1 NAD(P)-dependent dehydrogenase (short-subunit alcohol dehydrogenase family) [Mycolicibacterium sp. BK607]MBB3748016.1 NAD(P)-dependent dehydrogenase (short-subunit alcohol dehydrogenase family) [Mycolicibacterium sp. BK634]TDO07849.1 NAD(P)-dependent dehydrogenase (short-subunit alcohol dehydrogenase famil
MGILDGRVAVITGAGRGIGREHALLFAREGAAVVVNDLGGSNTGEGADSGPAHEVVAEITAAGGRAVANGDNISSWAGAKNLVQQAIDEFGRLDVLVNNAGILRDAFIAGMDEEQWDAVVTVHLKGHFAMLHHASEYWKAQSKAGDQPVAAVINTASGSGLTIPNAGQANYGAAKAGIAALTLIAAEELERYGVRVNAIAPIARTRLTLATPGMGALMAEPEDGGLDLFSPANISPLVAYLASEKCAATGQVYAVQGGAISQLQGWHDVETIETDKVWEIDDIAARLPGA